MAPASGSSALSAPVRPLQQCDLSADGRALSAPVRPAACAAAGRVVDGMMAGASCGRTAVPALAVSALVVSAVCVAAVSETDRGNDTKLRWQVQSVYSPLCMRAPIEQLDGPVRECIGDHNCDACARSGRTWRSSRGIAARGAQLIS